MSFNILKFYYGTEEEFEKLRQHGLDNCFYFIAEPIYADEQQQEIIDYKAPYKLYLNNEKIYDSNNSDENLAERIIATEEFQDKMLSYIENNSTKAVNLKNSLNIINDDSDPLAYLSKDGYLSASNYRYNKNNNTVAIDSDVFIEKSLNTNKLITKHIIENSEDREAIKINNVSELNFTEDALIHLPKIEQGGNSYDFEQGNFIINSIKVNQFEGPVFNNITSLNLQTLQIGNLILSDDGGNLKIQAIDTTNS